MKLSENKSYPIRLQKLIANGKYAQALKELETAILDTGGLFADDQAVLENRRAFWLMRIDILRSIGRHAEALAWVCLECELNPNNIVAMALKNQLIRNLYLKGRDAFDTMLSYKSNADDEWKGVAGMRQLKSLLDTEVVYPLLETELYKSYKVSIPNGVLFYGPPGCGKTFISKRLSERLKRKFIVTKPSDFASQYIHGTQEKIKALFEIAAKEAPCVFLLDELDALIPNRNKDISHSYSNEVNEFLVQLDRAASKGILVIGTTNYIDKIDPAAIRPGRFDLKIHVGTPDYEARMEIIKSYMKDRPQDFIDWDLICEHTEGKTYADLKLLIDQAAKMAIKQYQAIGMKQFYELLKIV